MEWYEGQGLANVSGADLPVPAQPAAMEAQQQNEKEKVEGDECPPEDGASEDATAEEESKKISFLGEQE